MIKSPLIIVLPLCLAFGISSAQEIGRDVSVLIDTCMNCHDEKTKSPLNMEELSDDLSDPAEYGTWVKIFDRLEKGEMPPESEPRPEEEALENVLSSLKGVLIQANLAAREGQRVGLRRLTRKEYEYTLHDLLGIHDPLEKALAPDGDSATFDTVAAEQRISPIHMEAYLEVADLALDSAIRLGSRPPQDERFVGYTTSPYVRRWYDIPRQHGGQNTADTGDAVALFFDLNWIMRSDYSGFRIEYPGIYHVRAEAYAYQAKTPVTLTLTLTNDQKGVTNLIGAIDLLPEEEPRTLELTTFLRPNDFFNPSIADLDCAEDGKMISSVKLARNYRGEGVAFKSLSIEGPFFDTWPPKSTRKLLPGIEYTAREVPKGHVWKEGTYTLKLSKEPLEHVTEIVERFAPLAFRRPLREGELESLVRLARPAIAEGRKFEDVIRVPLSAILSSPQFLYHSNDVGVLDGFALATRLSYFLWKSTPDERLYRLASDGTLSDPDVLAQEVDRMLDDEKSMRFVKDFAGQWLRLREIESTTPHEKLYPEYDDVLHWSLTQETELFLAELIKEDLGVANLIDSDFTFVNRRLAEHYGIPGVKGQHMRKVMLPEDSPRGGVLTHASILKITANGTVTSPVPRGNFVLTNILGTPVPPPPPTVEANIEPDIRGTATIRETLSKHREIESCANCHDAIDPPGFALESFGPIGNYRTRYRSTEKGDRPKGKLFGQGIFQYRDGPAVDPSAVTDDGKAFENIHEFKEILLEKEDQIALNLITQLTVYATGGEIQFADRVELHKISDQTRDDGYPVRSIVHGIVQSNLFRSK